MKFLNFYENLKEARMRLDYTVVLYDGEPYYIHAIADGYEDGIFRMFIEKTGNPKGLIGSMMTDLPFGYEGPGRNKILDGWLGKNSDCGVVRRMMNSPKFNRFRPFPLGMCNGKKDAVYLERQPQRHTQQGLTQQMVTTMSFALEGPAGMRSSVEITSPSMYDCITATFPDVAECLKNLGDIEISNTSVAFARHFAFLRGPVRTIFLVHKTDVIGFLPEGNNHVLSLASEFAHLKETIEELDVFHYVRIK